MFALRTFFSIIEPKCKKEKINGGFSLFQTKNNNTFLSRLSHSQTQILIFKSLLICSFFHNKPRSHYPAMNASLISSTISDYKTHIIIKSKLQNRSSLTWRIENVSDILRNRRSRLLYRSSTDVRVNSAVLIEIVVAGTRAPELRSSERKSSKSTKEEEILLWKFLVL